MNNLKTFFLISILTISILAVEISADVLLLNDGSEYKGKLLKITENTVFFNTSGDSVIEASIDLIKKIDLQKQRLWSDKKMASEITDPVFEKYYNFKIDSSKFKDPGCYYIYWNTEYKHISGSRWKITQTMLKKILKKRSESEGIVNYYYFDEYDTPSILFAFSIDPAGNLHHLDDNAMRSESLISIPQYENIRRYRFSLPETKEGAYIFYRTETIREYNDSKMPFYVQQAFREAEPVIHKSITIDVPDSMPIIYYLTDASAVRSEPVENNKRRIFNFVTENIEGYISEENMPPAVKIFPTLYAGLEKNWNTAAKNFSREFYEKFYGSEISKKDEYKKLQPLFDRIGVSEKATQLEKAHKIYDFILKNIDYADVQPDYYGFTFNNFDLLLKTMTGNQFDKTLILIGLLKIAGIDADFVLCKSSARDQLINNIPVIRQFDGCLCRIKIDDLEYFLAPYNMTMPFGSIPSGYQNTTGAIIEENKMNQNMERPQFKFIKIPAADSVYKNGYKKLIIMNVNSDDSIDAAEINEFYGNASVQARTITLQSEEEQKKYFEQSVAGIENNAELKDYSFSENLSDTLLFTIKQSYKIKDYVLSASDVIKAFRIPGMSAGGFKFSDTDRRFDIKWYGYEFSIIHAQINFPENYEVYFLPAAEKIEIPEAAIAYNRSFFKIDNNIVFETQFSRKSDFLDKKNYDSLRSFYENIAKKSEDWIVIIKKEIK